MKRKAGPVEKESNDWEDNSGLWSHGFHDLNSYAPDFSSVSIPNVPYFDLRIYRESRVKSLIKVHSKDIYSTAWESSL